MKKFCTWRTFTISNTTPETLKLKWTNTNGYLQKLHKKLLLFCYVVLLLAVDIVVLSTWPLIAESQLQKRENKEWHVFKVNSKDRRTLSFDIVLMS